MRAPLPVLLALACGCAPRAVEDTGRTRPNVLWIVVDSLRADHLGCYGHTRDTSPAIDALAREGVLDTP